MSWYCEKCGRIFDNPYTYEECVGEFWGSPAYQSFSECPYCGGSFEECEACDYCLDDGIPDDLLYFPPSSSDRICKKCFNELEKYKDIFFARQVPGEAPGYTWGDAYTDDGAESLWDFCCSDEEATEAFFLCVKEQYIREAAKRGQTSNVKIHYKELKK